MFAYPLSIKWLTQCLGVFVPFPFNRLSHILNSIKFVWKKKFSTNQLNVHSSVFKYRKHVMPRSETIAFGRMANGKYVNLHCYRMKIFIRHILPAHHRHHSIKHLFLVPVVALLRQMFAFCCYFYGCQSTHFHRKILKQQAYNTLLLLYHFV